MLLESINLKDFRCFYGEGSIEFATEPENNVTLIYAENGVGKTTLLNALLWCFFGETTRRFEKKEDILNYDAKAEGRLTASVEVIFEHDGKRYIAKRFFSPSVARNDDSNFKVSRIEGGNHIPIDFPSQFINQVMPKDMAGHFLFDGEHAEHFSSQSNRGAIQSAVRDILGCTLLETAIDDLKAASNYYRKFISSNSLSSEVADLEKNIENLYIGIETAKSKVAELETEKESIIIQISDIEQKLRNSNQAKSLQTAREKLNVQLENVIKRKKSCEEDVYKWLGDNGRFIVSKGITDETFDFLDEQQSKGRIPAPYNEEFVHDLLELHHCICGRPLETGSKEEAKVKALLDSAANKIMIDRVIRIRGRITSLRDQRKKAPAKLFEAKQKLSEENQALSKLEAEIAEYSSKIKNINFDDIAEKEDKRQKLDDRRIEIEKATAVLVENISRSEQEVKSKTDQIDQLSSQEEETQIYRQRKNLAERIKEHLELKLKEDEKSARTVIRKRIQDIITKTARKNFTVKLGEDYAIDLLNVQNIPVPKSEGENQLLGLAFTAALASFSRIRNKTTKSSFEKESSLLPGTAAPLVLDSPFSKLSSTYKINTAEFIPELAHQVIIMVSEDQMATKGDNEAVLKTLEPHIGKEYILIRHNKGRDEGKTDEIRTIKGTEIVTTKFDSEYDGTEIKEVA